MSSPFNCVTYRSSLEKLRNYTATAAFISDIGWKGEGFGHALCNKLTREETVCIMLGKVSTSRLNTSPIGNYNTQFDNPFHKAKFQFTLTTPDEPALMHDFQASVAALAKAQEAIASTEDSAYMILQEGAERSVRFSAPIFIKRDKEIVVRPSPTPPASSSPQTLVSSDEDEDVIDEETEKWPVPTDFLDDLEAIKTTYMANPLKVYMGNQFIEPLDVTKALNGALVEVHFTVQQYRLTRKSGPVHAFSALVQQVLILKKPATKSSPYKRKDYRRGPIKMPESPTKPIHSSAGTSKAVTGKLSSNDHDSSKNVTIMVPGNGLGSSAVNAIVSSDEDSQVTILRCDSEAEPLPPSSSPPSGSDVIEKTQEEVEEASEPTDGPIKKAKTDNAAQEEDVEAVASKGKGKEKAVDPVVEGGEDEESTGPGARTRRKTEQASNKTKATATFREGPVQNKG